MPCRGNQRPALLCLAVRQAGSGSFDAPASQYVALTLAPSAQYRQPHRVLHDRLARHRHDDILDARPELSLAGDGRRSTRVGKTTGRPFGTTTRVTRKVYPAFTPAEKLYWEASGVIIPLNLTQPLSQLTPSPGCRAERALPAEGRFQRDRRAGRGRPARYRHKQRMGSAGFHQRDRNELGLRAPVHLGYIDPWREVIVNEATGRIPVLNNGPPVGAGGNGVGGSYASLGAPQTQVELLWRRQ